jgi:hypothetical protein
LGHELPDFLKQHPAEVCYVSPQHGLVVRGAIRIKSASTYATCVATSCEVGFFTLSGALQHLVNVTMQRVRYENSFGSGRPPPVFRLELVQ